jgi:hypothetical protein
MAAPIMVDVAEVKAQIARLRVSYPELEEDAEALEIALEGQCDFREVLTRLVRLERETVTLAGAVKVQMQDLANRGARFLRRRDAYRAMMHALMDVASQTKVELPEATISVARDRAGCIITDETALPDKYVKIERVPKKTDILAALMSGEQVHGAELKNSGSTHLSIRV